MRVLSAAEMQACDRATTERFGVPSIELMRAASAAVAAFARGQFPHARRVTVLCGRGNNGGDGMMTAHLLASAGLDVTTVLLGSPDEIKGDAAVAWEELNDSPLGHIRIVDSAEDLTDHSGCLSADLIVDAVLGTGFKPPMKGWRWPRWNGSRAAARRFWPSTCLQDGRLTRLRPKSARRCFPPMLSSPSQRPSRRMFSAN